MPVGDYGTFGECVQAQQKKGKSKESASKICGEIEKRSTQKEGGSQECTLCQNALNDINTQVTKLKENGFQPDIMYNPVLAEEERIKYEVYNQRRDNKDRFFIKTFLFSAAINLNDWGVTLDSLKQNIYTFKNKPIVLTDDFSHPDNGKKYDTLENTLNYQEKFRIGEIVDIEYKDNIYYAIAEITDPKAKQMFRDNKLPMFVSPGIAHNDPNTRKSNWTGIHLAIVDRPAFTVAKAIIKGQCEGTYDICNLQLATASVEKESVSDPNDPNYNLTYTLETYKNNIDEIVKHNIILFNNNNSAISNSKMEGSTQTTEQLQKTNSNTETELNKPSTVTQTKNFDLNMCVSAFLEKGLDSNTAMEICKTAIGSTGGQGDQGFGNGMNGGSPPTSSGFSQNAYSVIANKFGEKVQEINVLKSQIANYENQLREVGIEPKNAIDFFKELKEKKQKEEYEQKSKEYTDFIKEYKDDEEEIKKEVDTYVKFNIPFEHVKDVLYKDRKKKENKDQEVKKEEAKTEAEKDTKPKAHELFNEKKDNELKNLDTSKLQKATAKQQQDKENVSENYQINDILVDRLAPYYDQNSSNIENGGNN